MAKFIVLSLVFLVVQTTAAWAQTVAEPFHVAAQVVSARSGEFESSELGFGGRLSWSPIALLGFESEINLYPADFPDNRFPFSASRLEGLFGVTAGPRLQRVRPFARARAGFLRFSQPTEGFACIAIFPPPLDCQMAAGGSRLILDFGGGLEVFTSDQIFFRVDAGDRMLRLPGPSFVDGLTLREDPFFSHDFRFALGGGLRF